MKLQTELISFNECIENDTCDFIYKEVTKIPSSMHDDCYIFGNPEMIDDSIKYIKTGIQNDELLLLLKNEGGIIGIISGIVMKKDNQKFFLTSPEELLIDNDHRGKYYSYFLVKDLFACLKKQDINLIKIRGVNENVLNYLDNIKKGSLIEDYTYVGCEQTLQNQFDLNEFNYKIENNDDTIIVTL